MIQSTEKESELFDLCHALFDQMGLFSIPAFLPDPGHFCDHRPTVSARTPRPTGRRLPLRLVPSLRAAGGCPMQVPRERGSAFRPFAY